MNEFLKKGVSQANYAPKGKKLEPSTEIGILVPGFLIPSRRHHRLPTISPIGPLAQAFADRSEVPIYTMTTSGRVPLRDRAQRLADSIVENPETAGTTTASLHLQSLGTVLADPLSEALKERGIKVRAVALLTPRIFNPMKKSSLAKAVLVDIGRTAKDVLPHPLREHDTLLTIAKYLGITVPSLIAKLAKGELPQEIRECATPQEKYENVDAPVVALLAEDDPLSPINTIAPDGNGGYIPFADEIQEHLRQWLPNSPSIRVILFEREHHGFPLTRPQETANVVFDEIEYYESMNGNSRRH